MGFELKALVKVDSCFLDGHKKKISHSVHSLKFFSSSFPGSFFCSACVYVSESFAPVSVPQRYRTTTGFLQKSLRWRRHHERRHENESGIDFLFY